LVALSFRKAWPLERLEDALGDASCAMIGVVLRVIVRAIKEVARRDLRFIRKWKNGKRD
jgi:hypothetical protein